MAHDQYLTYNEYMGYGGTASRVQDMATVPEAVKLCMVSLINIDSKAGVEAQVENPIVTSFNTDGYSESYGKALGAEDAAKNMNAVIVNDLYGELDDNGVPLLYRGVNGY